MPETPETEELEALIRALINKANDRLRQQFDDVRAHAESGPEHVQDLTEASTS